MKTPTTHDLAGKSISVDVYQKSGTTPDRAMVVAYGTAGMDFPFDRLIDEFCEAMADEGYLVVLPYYFESTATNSGLAGVSADLNKTARWIDTLAAAADWMTGQYTVENVVLAGFSLGANQVLNAALKSPVAGVIDYFGPVDSFGEWEMPIAAKLTKPRTKGLPPTLIHHGNADLVVPDSQSSMLKGWQDSHLLECTFHNDYACGHPGQTDGGWTAAAQKKAIDRSAEFLENLI